MSAFSRRTIVALATPSTSARPLRGLAETTSLGRSPARTAPGGTRYPGLHVALRRPTAHDPSSGLWRELAEPVGAGLSDLDLSTAPILRRCALPLSGGGLRGAVATRLEPVLPDGPVSYSVL